jgi:3',5'-cyclic AMP phosphodiesterase CpdA
MRQLRIVHLSDLHSGRNRTLPVDPRDAVEGYRPLEELIIGDLSDTWTGEMWPPGNGAGSPLLAVVTGDLTDTAKASEFRTTNTFLNAIAATPVLGQAIGVKNVFVVPGNHDVVFTAEEPSDRWAPYCTFYGQLFRNERPVVPPDLARDLTQVHDRSADGFVVAEINSCYYVQKGTFDENRGNVDMAAIERLRKQLEAIPESSRRASIRIALLHHHPVLFPALVEPGRGYDAVANSHYLLKLLREFGFHLVLHGHKHHPHFLTYDPDSAWAEREVPAMVVAAGGSAASRELPVGARACNTYNVFTVKWHPEIEMGRIRMVTRGLIATDGSGEMEPGRWKWSTLRIVDRLLIQRPRRASHSSVRVHPRASYWAASPNADRDDAEKARQAQYADTHLNMIMCEVLPSLLAGQAYQARVWLVPHTDAEGRPRRGWIRPVRVQWSAGPFFDMVECLPEDPRGGSALSLFSAAFDYWGPMLIQAQIFFKDEPSAYAYTYAGFPEIPGS